MSNIVTIVNNTIIENDNVSFKQIGNKFLETHITAVDKEPYVIKSRLISRKTSKKLFKMFFSRGLNMRIGSNFNNKNNKIIPKIGAGKVILVNFKIKSLKNKIKKIINNPIKKLITFFITKILYIKL